MQQSRLARPIILVGMMGAGKSAVGRALAELLAVPFLDSDAEIERAAGSSIAEIFARDGEAFFRDRESEVLRRLLEGGPLVLATGGGVWMQARNRAVIEARGVAVWLNADADLLWERVRGNDKRPLLRGPDPRGTLERLLSERLPLYRLAALEVRAEPGLSVAGMAEKTHAALAQDPENWTKT